MADNLYFLKTWFSFEIPEITCTSIRAPWVFGIRHSRFTWDTSAHPTPTQGGIIIKHKETQLRTWSTVRYRGPPVKKKETCYTRTFIIIIDDRWVMVIGDGIAGKTILLLVYFGNFITNYSRHQWSVSQIYHTFWQLEGMDGDSAIFNRICRSSYK